MNFIFRMLLLIDKMSWHHRKTTIIFIRENIRFREFETFTARSEIFFFLISRVKSWIKRYNVWKIYMTQLKRIYKKIRDVFWRWINSLKHRRFDFANEHSVIDVVSSTKWMKKMRTIIDLITMRLWISLTWRKQKSTQRMKSRRKRRRKRKGKIRNRRLFVRRRSRRSKRLRLRVANASEWKSRKKKRMMPRRMIAKIVKRAKILRKCRLLFSFVLFLIQIEFHFDLFRFNLISRSYSKWW